MNNSLGYLQHVDGLRALAVLIVIFFHFGITGFSGGFIGVDIFFVISGFLITRLITHELDVTGNFNFLQFYLRRIRRLMPALFFTFALTTTIAIIIFTPENLIAYGKSLIAAVFSVSNIFFWSESGYFDTASHVKPLLHTWSLSVEEQFYLLWPALLWFCTKKMPIRNRLLLVTGIGISSFLLTAYMVAKATPGFQSSIFYLAPFRVFEFAIGAIGVFIYQHAIGRRWQELLAATGFMLIIFSMYALDEKSLFPYVNALPSCVGALLLILVRDSQLVQFLLKNRLAIFIGLISYSLYLAHWPVYVFFKYIFLDVSGVLWIAVMLAVTSATAIFCYRYIELPWRRNRVNTSRFFKSIGSFALILCLFGTSMTLQQGWEWRYKPFPAASEAETADSNTAARLFFSVQDIENGKAARFKDTNQACNILTLDDKTRCDMTKPVQLLVFGNSHEPDAFNMFNALYQNHPLINLIVFGTVNDCAITIQANNISSTTQMFNCQQRFAILNDKQFISKLSHIIYNAHYGFDYVARELWQVLDVSMQKNSAIKLIAIGSYLETSIDCTTLINKGGTFDACKARDVITYFYPDERSISQIPEVKSLPYLYISKYELECEGGELADCKTSAGGEPMFYDQHHLSYNYARAMGWLIWNKYQQALLELGLPEPLINQ